MINNLQALGLGIVGLGVIIGVGIVVLSNLGDSVGGAGNTAVQYVLGQLGQSGLAGWIPAIIALVVGGLFLAYFSGGGIGRSRR